MKYTKVLGDKICDAIAHSSIGLRHICEKLKVPYSTVTGWVYDQEHEMYNKYIHAKQMQLGHLADEVLELLDNSTNDHVEVTRNGKGKVIQNREAIARTRLRIQGRIAIITKLAPVLYKARPEKIKHTVTVAPPPERKPTPEDAEKIIYDEHVAPPAPACPGHVDGENAGERSLKAPHSSPKTTIKYNADGTFEEYDEHGAFVQKSVIHKNAGHPLNVPEYHPYTGQRRTC